MRCNAETSFADSNCFTCNPLSESYGSGPSSGTCGKRIFLIFLIYQLISKLKLFIS